MINTLSQLQINKFPEYVKLWTEKGLVTTPKSLENAIIDFSLFQKQILKKPVAPVVILDSPLKCWIAVNIVKSIFNKSQEQISNISDNITRNFSKNYNNGYKVQLESSVNAEKGISVTTKIYDPNLNQLIQLSNVGAGIRSIYILSLLQTYCERKHEGALFLIEEPEIYLHPSLQKLMSDLLEEISETNQIIYTTHSPLMLKGINAKDVRLTYLDATDTFTHIATTSISQILKEIGYSTADVLHCDFVIIVEGKEDVQRIKLIFDKF